MGYVNTNGSCISAVFKLPCKSQKILVRPADSSASRPDCGATRCQEDFREILNEVQDSKGLICDGAQLLGGIL